MINNSLLLLFNVYWAMEVVMSDLLDMVHVEYLYEVRLPAVVLGEADHAQDALVPGGVSWPVVR